MSYLDRPTRKITFPSNPQLYAELYTELTWNDSKAFRDNEENDQNLFRLIKDWNLDIELTYENLQQLRRVDIGALFTAFNEIVNAEAAELSKTEKKKEPKSSSSKPPTNSPAENSL